MRLNFYRDETASCSEQVVFGDFGIARDVPAFKTTPIEFTPHKAREFTFACGMKHDAGEAGGGTGVTDGKRRRIVVASDHAGVHHKGLVIELLRTAGHAVEDFGTFSDAPVDYPSIIRPAALAVARGEFDGGVVLGGSGNGEAMVANRVPGIRCALCWNAESARLARAHNDANMLALGERLLTPKDVRIIVAVWLTTPFEGGRHARRVRDIDVLRPGSD